MAPQLSMIAQRGQSNNKNSNVSLKQIADQLYREVEALERDDPRWIYRKHLMAYKTQEEAKKVLPEYAKLQREIFLRRKRQVAEADLTRLQAQSADLVRQDQLTRRTQMALEYLDTLSIHFMSERFAYLSDEQKVDLVQDLYDRGLQFIYAAPETESSSPALAGASNPSARIIDMDEF